MERDVSVASGAQVVKALRSRGHGVIAVDAERGSLSSDEEAAIFAKAIDKKPPTVAARSNLPRVISELPGQGFSVVFIAMHGTGGEDGSLQSLLDLHGLRYTGSGRLGSALAWDKGVAKQMFALSQIPTPAWLIAPADAKTVERELGFPVVVKPSGQGSTVGLSLVKSAAGLAEAVSRASQFGGDVLIERYIPGRELTVGVLGNKPLTVGEIIPAQGDIFDYESKYQPAGADEIFPADIPDELAKQVQMLGLIAHSALRLSHYSRADFRLDDNGSLWCLEVNTLPGLSPGSLLPQSAAAAGIPFDELCERICQSALDG